MAPSGSGSESGVKVGEAEAEAEKLGRRSCAAGARIIVLGFDILFLFYNTFCDVGACDFALASVPSPSPLRCSAPGPSCPSDVTLGLVF